MILSTEREIPLILAGVLQVTSVLFHHSICDSQEREDP